MVALGGREPRPRAGRDIAHRARLLSWDGEAHVPESIAQSPLDAPGAVVILWRGRTIDRTLFFRWVFALCDTMFVL